MNTRDGQLMAVKIARVLLLALGVSTKNVQRNIFHSYIFPLGFCLELVNFIFKLTTLTLQILGCHNIVLPPPFHGSN